MGIRFVTDSTADLPVEYIREHDIKVIPFIYRIGEKAFSGCTALSSIRIPASATKIDQDAFVGCTALASCTFDSTDRWCRIPPDKYWAPYENVVEPDVDLTDPQANAAAVTDLSDTVLFKKRSVPRGEPAKARILTPVSARAEGGLFVQGRYFAPITPDEATAAAIREEMYSLPPLLKVELDISFSQNLFL